MSQEIALSARQKKLYSWMAFFIVPFSGVCIDVYSPSLPHMAASFMVVKALAQLSITTYMVGFAIGQLLAGSLSDSFGRRRIILLSCALFLVVTGLLLVSPTINGLLVLRAFQGLAVAGLVVPARAVLADCFSGAEFAKKISTMSVFWAMGPILAPAIGGYLQYHYNWQASFWFMLAYGLIILFLVLFGYRETNCNRCSFSVSAVFQNYASLIRDVTFLSPVVFLGMLTSILIVFNVVAPFIVQTTLHYNSVFYGYVALSMGLAWFLGSVCNGHLKGLSLRGKTQLSLSVTAVVLVFMLVASQVFSLNIYILVIPVWGMVFCASLVFPTFVSFCLARHAHIAGAANALFYSGTWAIVSLLSAAATYLRIHSMLPFAVFYAVICAVCWVFYCGVLRRYIVNGLD